MQNTNKTLAFDLGNVLFTFDYKVALNKVKLRMKASIPEVIYSLYDKNFTIPFEKGLVSGPQFHKAFMNEFGLKLAYEEFVNIWCEIFSPIPEVINLIKSLKGKYPKYPVYLISNINQLHFEYLYNKYKELFLLFNDLILSYRLKSVKPEFKIYQALSDAAGVPFSDIIYIDDRQDLILEAEKFKLNCIQFQNYQQLIAEFKLRGLNLS